MRKHFKLLQIWKQKTRPKLPLSLTSEFAFHKLLRQLINCVVKSNLIHRIDAASVVKEHDSVYLFLGLYYPFSLVRQKNLCDGRLGLEIKVTEGILRPNSLGNPAVKSFWKFITVVVLAIWRPLSRTEFSRKHRIDYCFCVSFTRHHLHSTVVRHWQNMEAWCFWGHGPNARKSLQIFHTISCTDGFAISV